MCVNILNLNNNINTHYISLSFLYSSNICICSITQLWDIRYLISRCAGTTLSIHSSIQRLIIMILNCLSFGSSKDRTSSCAQCCRQFFESGFLFLSTSFNSCLELSEVDLSCCLILDLSKDQINISCCQCFV